VPDSGLFLREVLRMSYERMLDLIATNPRDEEPCECGAAPHQAHEKFCGVSYDDERDFWAHLDESYAEWKDAQ
jgi:hypothetical protein